MPRRSNPTDRALTMRRQLRVPIGVKMASFPARKVPQCYCDPEGKGCCRHSRGVTRWKLRLRCLLTIEPVVGFGDVLPDGVGDAPPVPHAVPDHPGRDCAARDEEPRQTAWHRPGPVHGRAVGEVTNSGSSDPNASNPNGPATCRGASPTRILGAPVRSPGRRRVLPGSSWLGGREQLGPRRPRELPSRRMWQGSCAFQPPKGDGGQYAQRRLTLNAFGYPPRPCRWPQAAPCGEAGSGLR